MNTLSNQELEWEKTSFKAWLSEGDVIVTFIKTNGEERVMRCTLRPDALPTKELNKEGTYYGNSEAITVWDLDLKQWRSFRPSTVINAVILYKEEKNG